MLRRTARQHETLRTQAGVRSEDYWDFKPGDRVNTTDGYPGRVEAVFDGPFPGAAEYDVKLDGGMGGGIYTAAQLRKMADEEYTASKDYPELAEILAERPDPGKQVILAKKTAVTRSGREAKETRDHMDAQMRERGHEMDWKGVDLNVKGQSGHYVGECKNCGHSAVAGDNWSSSRGHVTTDARHSTCEGPGTAWKAEMVNDLVHQRISDAVGEFGQNVKNEQDKQWLRDQGIEAKKTSTTINDVKIDDHGDAPDELRADNPNAYDEKSTEGKPDPHQQEPLDKDKADAYRGAEIMKAPAGVSFGVMSPAQEQHVEDREDARQDVVDKHRQVSDARRDRMDAADIQRVEDPAYAKYLDHLSSLVVSAEWNDPEEGLDHHRDHDWGGIDSGHGEGGEWHDPEEARCYYKHNGPCPELGDVEPKLPMGHHTAMPSKMGPAPENFNYRVEETGSRYPGASTHALYGFVGPHHVGTLHFTKSDDNRAVKVDMLHHHDPIGGAKGIGSAMMDALYDEHPEAWINHGERSQQGLKWWSQYEDPAPERNIHNQHPSSGWDEYFHPRRVSLDMAENYMSGQEGNPLPHNSEAYGEPEREDDGTPKDLHGPHWGNHHWAQGHDGGRVHDDEELQSHARKADDDEDEHDGLDDVLFPGGDASDRWYERAHATGFELPGNGGRTVDDPERKAEVAQYNSEFPEKNHQLFSENAKTAHLILPPLDSAREIADHLVTHHGFDNDQIVNLQDPGQGDAADMAHYLEHENDPVSGEFGAGAIQDSVTPHSHEGQWADRTHLQSLNTKTAVEIGLNDIPRHLDEFRNDREERHQDDATLVPDWEPLHHSSLKPEEHDGWMFMERKGPQPKYGGGETPPLFTYKHGITRDHLHLDADGGAYTRIGGRYVAPGPADSILLGQGHYMRLKQLGAEPNTKYNDEYRLQRNKRLNDAGYQVAEGSKRLSDPYELVAEAATDPGLRFHFTASWSDVRAKAKRIRTEGRVRVTLATDGMIIGEVQGDHNTYESGIQRLPGQRLSVSGWSCGCKWGAYHWGAEDDFSRFAGRMCSHALALQFEAQSRGMFGNVVEIDKTKPDWVPPRVVVKHDIDSGQNRLVHSSAKHAFELETPLETFRSWAFLQDEPPDGIYALLRTAGLIEAAVNDPWGEPSVETPPKPYGSTSPANPYQSPASAGPLTAPDPDSWGQLDASGMSVTTTLHEATQDEVRDEDLSPEEREARWPQLVSTLHDDPEGALPSTDGDLENEDLEPENPSIMTVGQAVEVSRQIMLKAERERTELAEREANQIGGDDEIMDVTAPGQSEDDIVAQFQASAAGKALMEENGNEGPISNSDIAKHAQRVLALKAFSPAEQAALINEGMDVQASNLDRLDIAGTHYAELDDEGDLEWTI